MARKLSFEQLNRCVRAVMEANPGLPREAATRFCVGLMREGALPELPKPPPKPVRVKKPEPVPAPVAPERRPEPAPVAPVTPVTPVAPTAPAPAEAPPVPVRREPEPESEYQPEYEGEEAFPVEGQLVYRRGQGWVWA